MNYLPQWIKFFVFVGIWFCLLVITGLVWQWYELALYGETTIRARDGSIGLFMSCLGAVQLNKVVKELAIEYLHNKNSN